MIMLPIFDLLNQNFRIIHKNILKLPAIAVFLEAKVQHIVRDILTNSYNFTKNNSVNNDTIFYHFIGNFIPAEWKDLIGDKKKL
ncbi:hypothetical protein OCHUTO_0853 [Orientia chuto str. Dubai]|uniref:Uncharacterized protein n=1 Tax=Orientia chuto str. Dubai TaxID=1359168 RepID=A0A0F3MLA3_9RICK|nr:hypothetical protein OCHUTO_0853 [Orientia chuto str. Dubai]